MGLAALRAECPGVGWKFAGRIASRLPPGCRRRRSEAGTVTTRCRSAELPVSLRRTVRAEHRATGSASTQ
jgi:hypothetical protein